MPVDHKHAEYTRMAPLWKRCRDVARGQEAIHYAGIEYLPRLIEQSEEDYEAYKKRALFFNATWRTISALTGMMFRKEPMVEVPASVGPLLEDVTGGDVSLSQFSAQVGREILTVGRAGILVDYPRVNAEGGIITRADSMRENLRPTLALYRAESIINWRFETISNRNTLIMVVLVEKRPEWKDEFESEERDRWRVLDLVPAREDGTGPLVYRQRVFERIGGNGAIVPVEDDVYPTMNGAPMSEIPFRFVGDVGSDKTIEDPPLIDLVDVNLSHYRSVADYEHGCHFTALPTGYIVGHRKETPNETFHLGGQSMLVFPRPETKVGFLEFSGAGLGTISENIMRKEAQMAVLGARLLEAPKRGVEAAETAAIHRSGEDSVLGSVALSISRCLQSALDVFSQWAGATGEVEFDISTEFIPAMMTPADLTALIQAWQAGAISYETMFERLKASEVVDAERTSDEEIAAIEDGGPQLMNQAPNDGAKQE